MILPILMILLTQLSPFFPKYPVADPNWDAQHPNPSSSNAPYQIVNIGNHHPVALLDFIQAIEKATGKTAQKNWLPLQPGDVPSTYADIDILKSNYHYVPKTSLEVGVQRFVNWYRSF